MLADGFRALTFVVGVTLFFLLVILGPIGLQNLPRNLKLGRRVASNTRRDRFRP
jgi:hypothetical protein